MSVIKAGTTVTTALVLEGDTDGDLIFKTGSASVTAMSISAAGAVSLPTSSLTISSGATLNGGVVVNEPGADVDFRIESDTNTHALFVDGATGNAGIGGVPSDWTSTAHIGKVLQAGGASYFGRTDNSDAYVGSNVYRDTSDWKRIATGAAALLQQSGSTHYLYGVASGSANAAITWTQLAQVGLDSSLALQGATSQSGTGITFPATQSASSNANTLDDYEEGSFTPTAVCTGQTITYTVQGGSYTKIGNIVRVQINIVINTVSGAAGSNTTISGLPFSNGDTTYSGQAVIGYNDGFANTIYAAWITGTDMLFRSGTRSSGNDAGGFTAGGYIYINAVYRV
jgi:hypothetical protein